MNAKERDHKNWLKYRGLEFVKALKHETEIVLVGDNDCGKTPLIHSIFGDHPGLIRTNFGTSVEYRFKVLGTSLHILMQDVQQMLFVGMARIQKCLFLFCYDVDNKSSLERLKEIWIPAVMEKSLHKVFSLLVGIKREPTAGASSQQQVALSTTELSELCSCFDIGCHVECSIGDRDSMLRVFQSALDQAYPPTELL